MGKKLQLIIFLTFLVSPVLIWGQTCPSSVNISADPGTTICGGTSVTFTATSTGGTNLTYQWQVNNSNAGTKNSQFTTTSLINSDKVKVIVTSVDDSTCSTTSNTLTMTVNANRTGSVEIQADKTSICTDETVNFSIKSITNGGSSPTYTWQLARGGSTSNVGSASTYSSSSLQDGDQIQLLVKSSLPCTPDFSSNTITISEKPGTPSQPGSISGETAVCPGSSQTYSISSVADATSYVWTLPSGWSGTSSSTSITVTSGTSGGTILVAAKNECGTSSTSSLSLNIQDPTPSQPGSMSGPTSVCPGTSETYSVPDDAIATKYIWNLPSGWSGSSDTNSISVTTGTSGGTISVQAQNDCGTSTMRELSVSVKPDAPAQPDTISGNTKLCPGTSETYSISAVANASSYEWVLPSGWTGTSTSTSINITTGSSGTGTLRVRAINDCGISQYRDLNIIIDPDKPEKPGQINGSTTLCPGESGTFDVTAVANATSYNWTVPGGWTINSQNSNQINVTAGQLGDDGDINVTATNSCGTSEARTLPVNVKNPAPSQPGPIIGPAEICAGSTNTYSVDTVTFAAEYVWTLPNGSTQVTTSPSLSLTTSLSGDLNLSVQARNSCGTSSSSSKMIKSIAGVPSAPGTITSTALNNNAICPPATGIDLSVPIVAGADYYEWTFPNSSWVITSSDPRSNSIIIKIDANTSHPSSASVSVKAVNICGKSTASTRSETAIADYVVVNAGPDQTVCRSNSPINISGSYSFGNSNKNLNPVWSSSGTGIFGSKNKLSTTYTPSSTDINNGSVTLTLTTDAPSGACGPGKDEMKIFFRPDPTASISATTEVCAGKTGQVTFTATKNTTITYKINNGSNQTIQVGDSGSASFTTATLNSDTKYSLVNVKYSIAPECSKTVSGSATIKVNPVPSVALSYPESCTSSTSTTTVSFSNGVGAWQNGIFSASGDLSGKINTSDGSFTPSNVAAGSYTVTYTIPASGGCNEVQITTQVIIREKIVITAQPEPVRACEGGNIQFSITATGEGLGYQWYKGYASSGNEISGATSASLDLSNISPADTGDYLVVVNGSSPCQAVTSSAATLSVDENIIIDAQPQDLSVCENGTATFEVSATSGGSALGSDYTYQWYTGSPGSGTAVSGATSSILTIDPAALRDSGDYYVEITGPSEYTCSMAVSDAATLSVRETPNVTISGDNQICDGDNTDISFSGGTPNAIVTYTINNDNANPLTVNLDTSGNATVNTGALFATSNTDTDFVYSLQSIAYPDAPECTASVSGTATVTVAPNPEVSIAFPGDQTEFCNSSGQGSFTPDLSGTGTFMGGTFSTNGIGIDSSTGAITPENEASGSYTITYTVPAYGGCPEETTTLDIEIHDEVLITSQPFNLGICSTEDAEFSVVATGDDLTYQWYKDGNPVSGATSVVLPIPVATSEDAGEYYVIISGTSACTPDTASLVQSETVTLNVDEDIVIIEPAEDVAVCVNEATEVTFTFIAHAEGAPLKFTWIYADGTPVDVAGDPNFSTTLVTNSDGHYEGTLRLSNIDETFPDIYNGSYAVKIDGSDNNFTCPTAVSNSFNLEIYPTPDGAEVTDLEYCVGDETTALTATGTNLKWYENIDDTTDLGSAPIPSSDTAGTFTWYVSQTPEFCESDRVAITVTIHDLPGVPVVGNTAPEYCLGETATALEATPDNGSTLYWYDSETSTTPLESAPVPQTSAAGTLKFWVSQTNEKTCEGPRELITVSIHDLPNITTSDDTTICQGESTILEATNSNDSSGTTYYWDWEGNTGSALTGSSVSVSPTETTTYTVTGTDSKGCSNTAQVIINVDELPVGGTITSPESVCITGNNGSLTLEGHFGDIVRWEQKTLSQSTWTAINETTESIRFENLTEGTSYRAVLVNGVCAEVFSQEIVVTVDPEPVAGAILFNGTDRVFMMCEFPTDDYLVPLETTGTYVGEIVAWEYRRNSATEWSVITSEGSNFTGAILSGQQVKDAANNESTLFRVEVQSGACSPNVYSDYATLSIIPSDIAPSPVTAHPGVICIGEFITLSSGTGYGGYGTFEGGAFDNSSIANHGWRVMRYGSDSDGTEYTFESAADNTRPDRWMRTTPKKFEMANTSGTGTVDQLFDSCSCDSGNKGFAIVSGNNPSTLETPVFNLYATENPTLTFDQAYNLTSGDIIRVEISLDGGNTYTEAPLMEIIGAEHSGNYDKFGDDGLGEPNNMSIDLSQYAGLGNLRIRWLYDGSTGGIYTIDDIGLTEDPQNVQLIWYYDDDLDNPDNELEQIGEVNQSTVTYTPTKIGWNYFQVNTALVFDTNGDPCESAENQATIQVYVFDSYTTTATASLGSCGSTEVPLNATLTGGTQGEITKFPVDDESTIAWTVISGPDGYTFSESHFTTSGTDPAINDPNAVFNPPVEGTYTLSWAITADERNTCPIVNGEVSFNFVECTTLDFDGVDDYIDLGTAYSGNYFIEAWIRPETSTGTIISGPGFDIKMENLPASIVPNTRWYHIAVTNNGELYIDGISNGSISISGNGTNRTIIGARWNSTRKTTENHFSGWIEEVRIWNKAPELREIRFMMNQRLKLDGTGTVASPLEGEIVPNRSVAGSYLTDGGGNNLHLEVDGTLKPFYDQTAGDLAGYYRLISDNPDPLGLISFDPALQPSGGYTPDHALNKVPGRLYNITTDQENTSPTPYFSGADGTWADKNTWARPTVWDYPNSSYNGTPLDWNIAKINHNIESATKEITMLGLLSETLDKRLNINSSQFIRISHYLLLNGNMDLQGESQLLQDHGSILANESQGWAEIDQQGRMSSFNYNYWTSPVSNRGSDNNSGFMLNQVLLDGTTVTNPKPINFQNGYYVADGAKTDPITISNEWIWDFRGGTADIYGDWTHLGSDYTEIVGAGFSMKGTDGTVAPNTQTQNYVFRGKPNNGNIPTTDLYLTNNKNYLVGNPYPSAIDADQFLKENLKNIPGGSGLNNVDVFNGTLYFWDHFAGSTHILEEYIGGYATYTLSGSAPAISNDSRIDDSNPTLSGGKLPQRYIPVAQGFFLNSASVGSETFGGDIIFKNTQRFYKKESTGVSIFLQQEEELVKGQTTKTSEDKREKIRLKFESPKGYHRQILVTRDPNTTNGFDIGYDAPLIENNKEDMYWWFGNNAFVIQGVPDFDKAQVLPLAIKTVEEGQFTIKIDSTENWPVGKELYLKDKLKDTIHDILKQNYMSITAPGEIKDRFELVFFKENAQDPLNPNPDEPVISPILEGIGISYSHFSRLVKISNENLLNVSRVIIFDLGGKLIQEYDGLPTEREILLGMRPVRSGVYIVKVFSENKVTDKKIIVK